MKSIEAEETGAPIAYCIQAKSASEKRFDEAFDRASSEFHSVATDKSEGWVRFKSGLAWPRTTHPHTPNDKRPDAMPTTATDQKPKATTETPKGNPHQELVRRLVERTEYARLPGEITEEEASQLLQIEGEEEMTNKEAREVEALLSTDVGGRLATLVEDLTLGIINNAAREALTS
jgi:hypothetical protein